MAHFLAELFFFCYPSVFVAFVALGPVLSPDGWFFRESFRFSSDNLPLIPQHILSAGFILVKCAGGATRCHYGEQSRGATDPPSPLDKLRVNRGILYFVFLTLASALEESPPRRKTSAPLLFLCIPSEKWVERRNFCNIFSTEWTRSPTLWLWLQPRLLSSWFYNFFISKN